MSARTWHHCAQLKKLLASPAVARWSSWRNFSCAVIKLSEQAALKNGGQERAHTQAHTRAHTPCKQGTTTKLRRLQKFGQRYQRNCWHLAAVSHCSVASCPLKSAEKNTSSWIAHSCAKVQHRPTTNQSHLLQLHKTRPFKEERIGS